jgi:hypothetical protein
VTHRLPPVLFEASCHRQLEDECYEQLPRPPEPDSGTPEEIVKLPYCSWTVSTLPDPPEGYAFTHRVSAHFVPSEDDPCDPCDVDRLDALLRAAIEDKTSQDTPSCARMEPSEPMRGCVHPPDETSAECRVLGVFFSNYNDVPSTSGCVDCRDNDSCPGS